MSHVRSMRNKLVHNFSDHLFLEGMDDIPSELDRAYDVHTQLQDMLTEGDMISIGIDKGHT